MKKTELIKLKKLLQQEKDRRNRINELLSNDLIQEFLLLNNLNMHELQSNDNWIILMELLKEFETTESNGILVCTGSYLTTCSICYQETDYYTKEVSFDNPCIEYQIFKDIETCKVHIAYTDKYIQGLVEEENRRYSRTKIIPSEFCHSRYGRYLVSELMDKYMILNPYSSSKNENGFKEVQKDFFITAIEKGQPKAQQLVLGKYQQMK